jgi:hypothetical protein
VWSIWYFSPPRRQVRQGKKGEMREISQKPLQNPWFDGQAQIDAKREPGNMRKIGSEDFGGTASNRMRTQPDFVQHPAIIRQPRSV